MDSLSDILRKFILDPLVYLVSNHKKKMLFFVLLTGLWLVLLFPKSDTKNYIENQASSATKGSVDLELESLSISPFPTGVKLFSPKIRVSQFPMIKKPITADSIIIAPKMSSLLAFKLGLTAYLKNLLGGDGSLSFTLLGKNNENSNMFKINGDLEELDIQKLVELLGNDLKIPGLAQLDFMVEGEDSFRKQPTGDFKAKLVNLKLPNPLETPIGPFELPKQIEWKNSNIFGTLENGKINIKEGTLGTKTSEVNGRFKGSVGLSLNKIGPQLKVQYGRYDLLVELELSRAFEKQLGGAISSMIPRVNKKNNPNGTRYLFRINGKVPGRGYSPPPSFMPLSSFDTDEQ